MSRLSCVVTAVVCTAAVTGVLRLALDSSIEQEGAAGVPCLQLVSDEQEVGWTDPGPLRVPLYVANTGTETLVLQQVSLDPADAVATAPIEVRPGRVGQLFIELAAEQLMAGWHEVEVRTNDPDQPQLWLTVRGQVRRPTIAAGEPILTFEP